MPYPGFAYCCIQFMKFSYECKENNKRPDPTPSTTCLPAQVLQESALSTSDQKPRGRRSIPAFFALADHPTPPQRASCAAPTPPADREVASPAVPSAPAGTLGHPAQPLQSSGCPRCPRVPSSASHTRPGKCYSETETGAAAAGAARQQNKEQGSTTDRAPTAPESTKALCRP